MTVASVTNRISYAGAGIVGPFPVPFYFLEDDDLLVLKEEISSGAFTPMVLTTDYTVTGAGSAAGGAVTLIVALSSAYNLHVIRDPDHLQSTHYTPNDPFPATTHEKAVDKLTMLVQRVYDYLARCLKAPDTVSADQVMSGSNWLSRAGRVLGFDALGAMTTYPATATVYGVRREVKVATAAQRIFNLGFSYLLGVNALSVYVNGLRVIKDVDYSESAVNQVTFLYDLALNDRVEFVGGQELAGGAAMLAALVQYIRGGVGAVYRTVLDFISDRPATPEDFGAVGDGVTNDNAAFAAMVAASDFMELGAKTYVVDTWTVPANKRVRTAGFKTVLKQRNVAGRTDQPIVKITGGNVDIDSFQGQGNIATDAGEWNHVVYVVPTAPASNIRLGVVGGTNIRGDVIAMDCAPANQLRNVKVDGVLGTNCLRSVCSIIAVDGCEIGFVEGYQTGYSTLDIEPNGAASGICDNIRVGLIRGGKFQIAGQAANVVGTVKVDAIEIDRTLMVDSVPTYAHFDLDVGLLIHHFRNLYIGSLNCQNKNWNSIRCASGTAGGNIHIGRYFGAGQVCGDPSGSEIVVDGAAQFKMDYAVTTLPGITKFFLSGNPTLMDVSNVNVSGGRLVQYASRGSRFTNWIVDATGTLAPLMYQTDECIIDGFTVTAGAKFLDDTSTGCAVRNSNIGCAVFAAAGVNHVLIATTAEGNWVGFGIWDNDYRDSARIGAYRLWVDADGKMLRKNANPASDTDGTSVGLGSTKATIGANGAAAALTALPVGYVRIRIAGTEYQLPYYNI